MGKGVKAVLWVAGALAAFIGAWFVTMAGATGGGHWY